MTGERATVVIIGAGIVGASIAYHLALRGCHDVLILEQAETEVAGSTARSAAGIRHQFATEVNIQLSLYSIERLKHFNEEVGGYADVRQVGYLLLINDPATWRSYQAQVALQHRLGVHTQVLTAADVLDLAPGTNIDDLLGATFGPDDGYCDPHGIAMGYLRRARQMGVRLHRATPAVGFQVSEDRITTVETPYGAVSCEVVVNATGAWSGQVAALAGLAVPVQPYRRNVYVTEPFAEISSHFPMTIDVGSGYWMRKEQDSLLFGLSKHDEPPGVNLTVDWEWLGYVLETGLGRFPFLAHARLARQRCWAGLYEITPDHNPILGRHPQLSNYINASGFSGHGVMHSPATGLLMAEEILDGRAHTIDIDALRITRFLDSAAPSESNIF
jgi:sarcosine oxidase subunit beta